MRCGFMRLKVETVGVAFDAADSERVAIIFTRRISEVAPGKIKVGTWSFKGCGKIRWLNGFVIPALGR